MPLPCCYTSLPVPLDPQSTSSSQCRVVPVTVHISVLQSLLEGAGCLWLMQTSWPQNPSWGLQLCLSPVLETGDPTGKCRRYPPHPVTQRSVSCVLCRVCQAIFPQPASSSSWGSSSSTEASNNQVSTGQGKMRLAPTTKAHPSPRNLNTVPFRQFFYYYYLFYFIFSPGKILLLK